MPRSPPNAGAGRWKGASPAALADCDIIVDALFGAGLDRDVEGLPRAMIDAMNAGGAPIVAVDLPSGVNGTSGAVMGVAVNATQTVTFFRRKTGHLLLPGRLHCGAVQVADIGIPESVLDEDQAANFRQRSGTLGWLVSAADLAGPQILARPCGGRFRRPVDHRRGAVGRARGVACRRRAGDHRQPARGLGDQCGREPGRHGAAGRRAGELGGFLTDKRRNAVVLGPGGGVGAPMREQVLVALASEAAVVLDADALTSFADDPVAWSRPSPSEAGPGRRPDAA